MLEHRTRAYRAVGADIGVDHAGIAADDRRATHAARNYLRPLLDHHRARNIAFGVDESIDPLVDLAQHQTIGLEEIARHAGILPPSGDLAMPDLIAMLQQIVVRVADLQLPARA